MARYEIKTRDLTKYIDIPKESLFKLYYEERLTQEEMAQHFGVSSATIRKRMAEYCINRSNSINITEAELRRLYYQDGLTQIEIAQRFGVDTTTISKRMTKYGMETRSRKEYRVDIPKEVIEELYAKGLTQQEIGQRFGVTGSTIKNRMAEYGLETRGHWDYVYIDIPKEELERLYVKQEWSGPAIAELYGCANGVVYRRMKEHGIPTRPAGWDKLKRIVPAERLESEISKTCQNTNFISGPFF